MSQKKVLPFGFFETFAAAASEQPTNLLLHLVPLNPLHFFLYDSKPLVIYGCAALICLEEERAETATTSKLKIPAKSKRSLLANQTVKLGIS